MRDYFRVLLQKKLAKFLKLSVVASYCPDSLMIFLKVLDLLIQHHDVEHYARILKLLQHKSSIFSNRVRTPSPNQIDVEITNFILHFFDQILHGRLGVVELRLSHARYTSLSFILPGMDILQNIP